MEEPVIVRRPETDPVPVVFDSPHSGIAFPDDMRAALPRSELLSGWDAFVDELFGPAPAHGATLVAATFPRIYIDPNRAVEDLDAALIDGEWPGPVSAGEKTRIGKGLIWSKARGEARIYDRKLSVDEIRSRIERYWRPYVRAVGEAVDAAHARFGAVWHVNCHSMPSVWPPGVEGGGTPVAADFILGDRDGTTCAPEFTAFVRDRLTAMGYRVAVNDRFKGVELVRTLGRPAEGRHSLQIEVVRSIYMDETRLARSERFARIAADLERLVADICGFARAVMGGTRAAGR